MLEFWNFNGFRIIVYGVVFVDFRVSMQASSSFMLRNWIMSLLNSLVTHSFYAILREVDNGFMLQTIKCWSYKLLRNNFKKNLLKHELKNFGQMWKMVFYMSFSSPILRLLKAELCPQIFTEWIIVDHKIALCPTCPTTYSQKMNALKGRKLGNQIKSSQQLGWHYNGVPICQPTAESYNKMKAPRIVISLLISYFACHYVRYLVQYKKNSWENIDVVLSLICRRLLPRNGYE